MKAYILTLLLLMTSHSLVSMELDTSIPSMKEASSILSLPDIGMVVLESLILSTTPQKALKDLKALICTNTAFSGLPEFFKSPRVTRDLLKRLYYLSYYDRFKSTSITQLASVIDAQELALFEQSLIKGKELVVLFGKCAANNNWEPALKELKTAEEASLHPYLALYYQEGCYQSCTVNMMLLTYALALDAPESLLKTFIRWKSPLTKDLPLLKKIPLPCSILVEKLSILYEKYKKECSKTGANVALLTEQFEKISAELKSRIDMLIAAGCRLTEYWEHDFFGQREIESPLHIAFKTNNEDLIQYILQKREYSKEPLLLRGIICEYAVLPFLQGRLSLSSMKALIEQQVSECELTLVSSLMYLSSIAPEGVEAMSETFKEKILQLVSLFLSKENFNVNFSLKGVALLDIVQQNLKFEELANLLINHGAIQGDQELSNLMKKITELIRQISFIDRIKDNSQRDEKKAFYLKEACDIYSNNTQTEVLLGFIPYMLDLAWT
ncbi:hypothetical protein H0W26_01845, partial [Candidatus Dependentiae bacterium]|nr:hypothetical protein [Candidatus Dependentiae bacterium]